jgi:hypothetical protein
MSPSQERPKESLTLVRKLKNHLFQRLLEHVPKPGETKREPYIGDEKVMTKQVLGAR